MNLLLFPYMNMVPVIARDVLHVGPGLMGLFQGATGLGSLVGAAAVASAAQIRHHGRLYTGGAILALLCLLLFAVSESYLLSAVALGVLGLGVAGFSTMQPTIVMLIAGEERRGATLGVISIAIGVGPLGALAVGGVATATSPSVALAINAAVGIVLVTLVLLAAPSLRRMTEPSGAATGRGDARL